VLHWVSVESGEVISSQGEEPRGHFIGTCSMSHIDHISAWPKGGGSRCNDALFLSPFTCSSFPPKAQSLNVSIVKTVPYANSLYCKRCLGLGHHVRESSSAILCTVMTLRGLLLTRDGVPLSAVCRVRLTNDSVSLKVYLRKTVSS
jgi:hypothetical protein